jgi:hypothetical protein
VKQLCANVIDDVIDDIEERGGSACRDTFSTASINGEFSTVVMVVPCGSTKAGRPVWKARFERRRLGDITIVARLTANNNTILDYYVLPLAVLAARPSLCLGPRNAAAFEAYRFDKLDRFCELVGRSPVPVAG